MGVCSCCTSCLAKCVLGIVNSVFMTVGILLTIFGALFYWGQTTVYNWISSVLSKASNIGSSRQLSLDEIQTIMGAWSKYITYAGLILFCMGFLLVALAIAGYVGMCCEIKVLVIAYTVVVGVFALGCVGIIIGYAAFKREMVNGGRSEMRKLLQKQYGNLFNMTIAGVQPNDLFTTVMDLVQARMSCCGVDNSTDFKNAFGWNRTYVLDGKSYNNLTAPVSCCKISGPTMKPDSLECLTAPNSINSNFDTGCYDKLWTVFDNYSAYTMYGLGVAAAVSGCIVVLAIIVLCDMFD